MAESDTCPIWKKIYHTVTDGNTLTTGDVVDQILGLCKGKLVAGLLQYPFYNKESFQPWKDNPGLKEFVSDTEMCNFIHTLSKDLNLEVNSAWIVLCNYLMYDYFGKIDELKSIIRYDTNLKSFIDNVWYFYTADRMFLLKTLRHIFEKVHDEKYVYQQQFDKFLKSIDANIFWNNLVKAFEGLITEIDSDRVQLTSVDSINRWIHRNNREQVEVGLLLVHATKYCTLDGNELEKVLSVFIKHGFTRHPMYRFSNSISRPADIVDIKYVEVGCVLTILERYWKQPGIAKMLPKNLEQSMELIQMQGDNSIILFAWAVLKTSIDPTEETMEYCNTTACNLGNKRLFVTIYRILINKLFAKSKAGDLVIDGVFQLMVEFIKLCADYSCLHEQEGICYVVAELIKRKGGVVLDYLGPMFQLAIDAFPFLFTPFLEMCKALIELPEYYDNIMKLLKKMPGYVTEIPWNNNKDSYLSVEPQNIFIDCDLFEIPAGTPVEKFVYKGMFFARYMYPYSFFALMEQFVRCLFGFGQLWNGYDNLAELVEVGYLCVSHILKHYKGDFRSDTSLRRLITRLEVIPAQILNGPTRNFEFLRIYMEINVTLVTRNMLDFSEAFPLIVRKQFFPQLPSYTKVKHHLVINQIYNESTLFKCLKEEEGMTDHTLLIEYLKLIEDLLKHFGVVESIKPMRGQNFLNQPIRIYWWNPPHQNAELKNRPICFHEVNYSFE